MLTMRISSTLRILRSAKGTKGPLFRNREPFDKVKFQHQKPNSSPMFRKLQGEVKQVKQGKKPQLAIRHAAEDWLNMAERTSSFPTKIPQQLNNLIGLIRSKKYEELDRLIKPLGDSKFKIKLAHYAIIVQNLLFDEIEGRFDQKSQNKIKIAGRLTMLLQQTNSQFKMDLYSNWLGRMLSNYVRAVEQNPKVVDLCQQKLQYFVIQLLQNYYKLIREDFFASKALLDFFAQTIYGKHQKVGQFINIVSKTQIDTNAYIKAIRESLMMYRIVHKKPAFVANKEFLQTYKKAFEVESVTMVLTCLLVATDCGYTELLPHFRQYNSQVFEKLPGEATKKIKDFFTIDNSKDAKQLGVIAKTGQTTMLKIQAAIKKGDLKSAHSLFVADILKSEAINRWRHNVMYVLKAFQLQVLFKDSPLHPVIEKEGVKFVKQIKDEIFWKMYLRSQDFLIEFQQQLHKDTHSFWRETFRKQRADEIFDWEASGFINKVAQVGQVPPDQFNLQQYLNEKYPQEKQDVSERYEVLKQLTRFCYRVDGLIEEQKVESNSKINDQLKDAQRQMSEEALQVIQYAGLKDYDVVEYDWDEFVRRFKHFRRHNHQVKDPKYDIKKEDLREVEYHEGDKLNISLLNDIFKTKKQLYQDAENIVKTTPNKNVQPLLLWGLYAREPMAIYMAEKLAMITGQVIPHQLAKRVSDMFSYRRQIEPEIIDKCRDALRVIGKIDRDAIYDQDKVYQHILGRKSLQGYAMDLYINGVNDQRLLDINVKFPLVKDLQQQPAYFLHSAEKGPVTNI